MIRKFDVGKAHCTGEELNTVLRDCRKVSVIFVDFGGLSPYFYDIWGSLCYFQG